MKTSICIVLLVIGFISECHAQSGWILWEEISFLPPRYKDEWRVVQAYPSFGVCQRQVTVIAEAEAKHAKDSIPEFKDDPVLRIKGVFTGCEEKPNCASNGYSVWVEMKGETFMIFHEFKCFPATFDPRK